MKIGLLGAYGIDNTGDNLIALATKHAVEELVNDAEITIFYPNFSKLFGNRRGDIVADGWKKVDMMSRGFWEEVSEYQALIIGGGGILLPVPEFEPFLLYGSQIDHSLLPKTAWNAIGTQWIPLAKPKISEWYKKLRTATQLLDYVSVRSATTYRILTHAECPMEKVNLVPDPVINLKFNDSEKVRASLLDKFPIDKNKQIIGVSIGPELTKPPLKDFMIDLARALNYLQKVVHRNIQIVIFPFGLMYGDSQACLQLAELCPDSILLKDVTEAKEIWELVGLMDVYLTVRLHGIVAALSHGIPALALDCYLANDTAGSKLRDFMWESELESYYLSPIISICGDPQMRSFTGTLGARNTYKDILRRIEELLIPENRTIWEKVSQKRKEEIKDYIKDMVGFLDLI
ncbi:hypothetical protein Cpap_1196 [Ruminiclostridium papyrosolvens DSM 2782]|uniref:Polysaccharide pyruvyl transferase domain-containing protein n=1 Tax=Ruminiclostridium papyrosolvens DSM 2782 TaxID=588581 RepID=F1TF63_9FIRM|nr:polysaccharide pyruvyl transferase family protein [Ruminiclostridium papyrosolvens]EGD47001.1 hypothetical protein Cpap_1196 [Ruminiclostridium papyrosolvens DSM 2782]WES33750.1 polysaccharide pyruvyl transferase family protein [Ruminiclostridium papyrosolvens DSM 2782]